MKRPEPGLTAGASIELRIEKPAAGGRMIARHAGRVVLVSGAIPGERVVARIDRADRRVAFASATEVVEPSDDRRVSSDDPLCGGCTYSHISYPRQLVLKSAIVRDAFLRLGHIPLQSEIDVTGSPERGYRMRARFHVENGRAGFYREGTHRLCDPAVTGQLADAALAAVHDAVGEVETSGARVQSVELTENVAGDARGLSVVVDTLPDNAAGVLNAIVAGSRVTGCALLDARGRRATAGEPAVSDDLSVLTAGRITKGTLSRQPESFFQANRFLIAPLVTGVMDLVPDAGRVLDLYAGVGLFSAALAATGNHDVTAVEGHETSGADLRSNARQYEQTLRTVHESVEAYLSQSRAGFDTIVVDPPRTGISAEALDGIVRQHPRRLVYVSCDPATLARDARRLLDAGYLLGSLRAFDLFPNTPHVEALAVFDAST